ncbi:hypothetical protein CKO_02365 [Citrobacter koseri ATCC BAA-895]|uniref:Uncharacterized protein n=1 Tax=Citrobacter koseri (strain ATCC BAA-895 / CDC 4225-83 / SGSC4696) TaxID=290338 RepID=A8AJ24_CITK8|nr:hypothetical protein CKO_02365 [Citrobacter koseri ATCC BAA-895]
MHPDLSVFVIQKRHCLIFLNHSEMRSTSFRNINFTCKNLSCCANNRSTY